jgi:hypothetical protein
MEHTTRSIAHPNRDDDMVQKSIGFGGGTLTVFEIFCLVVWSVLESVYHTIAAHWVSDASIHRIRFYSITSGFNVIPYVPMRADAPCTQIGIGGHDRRLTEGCST